MSPHAGRAKVRRELVVGSVTDHRNIGGLVLRTVGEAPAQSPGLRAVLLAGIDEKARPVSVVVVATPEVLEAACRDMIWFARHGHLPAHRDDGRC